MRWLALLIGASALAMTLAVVLGVVLRNSEPSSTASTAPSVPLIVRASGVEEDAPPPIGGPDDGDQSELREREAGEDLGVAPEIVVDGGPGVFTWPLGGTFEQSMTPWHPGIDIGSSYGTPVRAARDGTVTFVGGDPCCSYGLYVIVQHTEGWSSRYAHMGSFSVGVGDTVAQGQPLGTVGLTGRTSGPHLHFELIYYGAPIDPLDYLPGGPGLRSDTYVYSPPPSDGAADEPVDQPDDPPAPANSPATPEPVASSTAVMVSAAASWLSSSGDYIVGSCGGGQAARNQWLITCETERTGCDKGAECLSTKLVCVIDEPLTIWFC